MTSKIIKTVQCPKCAENGKDTAKDNLCIKENGWADCYACGYANFMDLNLYKEDSVSRNNEFKEFKPLDLPLSSTELSATISKKETVHFISGQIKAIPVRAISERTCKLFDYQVGQDNKGNEIHIANHYNLEKVKIKQQIRYHDKSFSFIGEKDTIIPLFGMHLWSPNPNLSIVITEGAIDAMSVAEVQSGAYPVVSLTRGVGGAKSDISNHLNWLLGFKDVILFFDNDEAGQKAIMDVLPLFPHNKVRVAKIPLKDANDMLRSGKKAELNKAILFAQEYKPDCIITIEDVLSDVLEQPQWGILQPWTSMDNFTFGLQMNEIQVIVAANAIGKSEFILKCLFHYMESIKVALFSFEYKPSKLIQRLVSTKLANKSYLPGEIWDRNLIRDSAMELNKKIWLYNKIGSMDINELFNSIRFLYFSKNVKVYVIDNIKGLHIHYDKTKAQEFMTRLQTLVKELDITVILLSHVNKDNVAKQSYWGGKKRSQMSSEDVEQLMKAPGMTWESGRMPTKENVEGFSVITDLADTVLGLARNTVSNDIEEARTLRVKMLKCKMDSKYTGNSFKLYYTDKGTFEEVNAPESNRK